MQRTHWRGRALITTSPSRPGTIRAPADVWDDEQVLAAFRGVRGPDVHEEVPAWVAEGRMGLNAGGFAEYAISVGRNRAEDAAIERSSRVPSR